MATHNPRSPTVYWGCKCKTFVVQKPLRFSKMICAICEYYILEPLKPGCDNESSMSTMQNNI